PLTLSCGDPQRNQNYGAALWGSHKSAPVEARAAARFALTERPGNDTPLSLELRTLRQVAGRLQAVVRQRTRLINQLHHLLALAFPELALLVKDLAAGWVLELVHRYPTAARLAEASASDLADLPYLPDQQVGPLLEHARSSIASQRGPAVEELVRDQVRQLRDAGARQKRLDNPARRAHAGVADAHPSAPPPRQRRPHGARAAPFHPPHRALPQPRQVGRLLRPLADRGGQRRRSRGQGPRAPPLRHEPA